MFPPELGDGETEVAQMQSARPDIQVETPSFRGGKLASSIDDPGPAFSDFLHGFGLLGSVTIHNHLKTREPLEAHHVVFRNLNRHASISDFQSFSP
jgi:hypothetical protein